VPDVKGEVVRIIKRGIQTFVEQLNGRINNSLLFQMTDEWREKILIAREHLHEAKEGDKVVVKITKWGKHRENSERANCGSAGKSGEFIGRNQICKHGSII